MMECVIAGFLRGAAALATVLVTFTAYAGCNFGPDECKPGFVWREATREDHVCVTGAIRNQTATDNAAQAQRRVRPVPPPPVGSTVRPAPHPGGCMAGYVFRGSVLGDDACVSMETWRQVQADNAAAASRVALKCGKVGSVCSRGSRDSASTELFQCPGGTSCEMQTLSCGSPKLGGCGRPRSICKAGPNFHDAAPVSR
jgi:hypothetical protein